MNLNMMNFQQNGMMNMAGVPSVSAPFMAGMQNTFNPNLGDMSGAGVHNPGAIRRGGGRFGNQRSGPYDRNQRGPRGAGMRPLPMMGLGYVAQGGGGGGGKWGDGSGGGMAMGPREAVAGRSIKSYEDLDAQPGVGGGAGAQAAQAAAGGAELDY